MTLSTGSPKTLAVKAASHAARAASEFAGVHEDTNTDVGLYELATAITYLSEAVAKLARDLDT